MSWKPVDRGNPEESNDLRDQIQSLYDRATLRKLDEQQYITARRYDELRSLDTMLQALPSAFRAQPMGPTEVELTDFILHRTGDNLRLVGRCGAGKTSLIRHVMKIFGTLRPDIHFIKIAGENPDVDFRAILCRRMRKLQGRSSGKASAAFADVATKLSSGDGAQDVPQLIVNLVAALGPGSDDRLVLVVDNLDHLPRPDVDAALELAKRINSAKPLTTIVAMRPGTLMEVAQRGSSRAFFSYRLDVWPPDADVFLQELPSRMAAIGAATPDVVRMLNRAVEVLMSSTTYEQDSVVEVLRRASASDFRLLSKLLRRIVGHRSLPTEYIRSGDGAWEFHPVVAMVEGARRYYDTCPTVPNTLSFRTQSGSYDFLICHRLLRLLDRTHPTATTSLLQRMKVLGYRSETTDSCLRYLHSSSLVEFSDSEVADGIPAACLLTEAGWYYLHHMLENADYLTSVLMCVPLRHQRLRTDEAFIGRLDSLVEYCEEVLAEESRTLYQYLPSHEPSIDLLLVAESLSRGGLLICSLSRALHEIVRRSRTSKSESLKEYIRMTVEPCLKSYGEKIAGFEARLVEIANRGRSAKWGSLDQVETRFPTVSNRTAKVILTPSGSIARGEVEVEAIGADAKRLLNAIVVVHGQMGGEQLMRATMLSPSDDAGELRLVGELGSFQRGKELRNAHVELVPLSSNGPQWWTGSDRTALGGDDCVASHSHGRTALLSVADLDGVLDLRIYVPTMGRLAKVYQVGGHGSLSEIVHECQSWLKDVGDRVIGGTSFQQQLRACGTKLGNRLLSRDGRNILEDLENTIDTLVIATTHFAVPWEWLMVPPRRGRVKPPSIGDKWRTIRWHRDPLSAALGLHLVQACAESTPILTVGIPQSGDSIAPPPDVGELQLLAMEARTLHLVGHASSEGGEPSIAVLGPDTTAKVELTLADLESAPFFGCCHVVLSVCGAAAADSSGNLASTIALKSHCVVWAPMVKITMKQAQIVDESLRKCLNDGGSVEEFFRVERIDLPLLQLYVRYGVSEDER